MDAEQLRMERDFAARQASRPRARWSGPWLEMLAVGSVLFALWSCGRLVVLAFPQEVARLTEAARPATERLVPLMPCKQAIAMGYVNIPVGSPAYAEWRDADNDGLACEPYPALR